MFQESFWLTASQADAYSVRRKFESFLSLKAQTFITEVMPIKEEDAMTLLSCRENLKIGIKYSFQTPLKEGCLPLLFSGEY